MSPSQAFPTMSADSVSNTAGLGQHVHDGATAPAAPTTLSATRAGWAAGEPDVAGQRDQRDGVRGGALRRPRLRARPDELRADRRGGPEEQHGQRDVRGHDGGVGQHLPRTGWRRSTVRRAVGLRERCGTALVGAGASGGAGRPHGGVSRAKQGNNYPAALERGRRATGAASYHDSSVPTTSTSRRGSATFTAAGSRHDPDAEP